MSNPLYLLLSWTVVKVHRRGHLVLPYNDQCVLRTWLSSAVLRVEGLVLGRILILGMGLGPSVEWAGAAKFSGPTLTNIEFN